MVLALGKRLLVLVPTEAGELLLLLPRSAAEHDELLKEVVESVRNVSCLILYC